MFSVQNPDQESGFRCRSCRRRVESTPEPFSCEPSARDRELSEPDPVQILNTSTHCDIVMMTCQTVGGSRSADGHTPTEQELFSFPSAPSSHVTPLSLCFCVCMGVCQVVTVAVNCLSSI